MMRWILDHVFMRSAHSIDMLRSRQASERAELNSLHAFQRQRLLRRHAVREAILAKLIKDPARLYKLESKHRDQMLRLEEIQARQRTAMNERHIRCIIFFPLC